MRRTLTALCLTTLLLSIALPSFAAGPAAKVSDLAWMTGSWKGPSQGGTIEENWIQNDAGSIASLVRGVNAQGATNMIELIVIEEEEGSLVLRLQQWNPGFEPRSDAPQVMDLLELGDRMVKFKNRGEGIPILGYSLVDGKFSIHITISDDQKFAIPLSAN